MFGFTEVTEEAQAKFEKESRVPSNKKYTKAPQRVALKNRFGIREKGGKAEGYFLDPVDPAVYTPDVIRTLNCLGVMVSLKPYDSYEVQFATKTKNGNDNWNNYLPHPCPPNFRLNPITRLTMLKSTGAWNVFGKALEESDNPVELAKKIFIDPDEATWKSLLSEANFLRNEELCRPNGYTFTNPIDALVKSRTKDGKPRFPRIKCKSYPTYLTTILDTQKLPPYNRFNRETEEVEVINEENEIRLYPIASKALPKLQEGFIAPVAGSAAHRSKKWQGLAGYVALIVREKTDKAARAGELASGGDIEGLDEIRKLNPDALIDFDVESLQARLEDNFSFYWYLHFAATGVQTPAPALAKEMAETLGCVEEKKSFFYPANYLEICLPKLPGYYEKVFAEELAQLAGGVPAQAAASEGIVFSETFKPANIGGSPF